MHSLTVSIFYSYLVIPNSKGTLIFSTHFLITFFLFSYLRWQERIEIMQTAIIMTNTDILRISSSLALLEEPVTTKSRDATH